LTLCCSSGWQDGEQLPDEVLPLRGESDADSRVRTEVDDEEEVQQAQGSDDDEGEDLLEGMEGCVILQTYANGAMRGCSGQDVSVRMTPKPSGTSWRTALDMRAVLLQIRQQT